MASFSFVLENELEDFRSYILASCSNQLTVPRGTVLMRGGFPTECFYFVLDGLIRVSVFNTNGYERILGYHKRNTLLGMDGLKEGENVVVSSTTLTSARVLRINRQELKTLCQRNIDFTMELLRYYSDVLKLMCYDAESQSSNSVLAKLSNFLVLYSQSRDYQVLGYIPFSQAELAASIGASRVQVARVCAELKKRGLIEVEKGKAFLLNEQGLMEYVSFQDFR